jgi:hypothetical protein
LAVIGRQNYQRYELDICSGRVPRRAHRTETGEQQTKSSRDDQRAKYDSIFHCGLPPYVFGPMLLFLAYLTPIGAR